jgi:hypothetical protein
MNRIADPVGSLSFAAGQEIRELRVLALNRGSGRPLPGLLHPADVSLAKTANRRVLGCMNDMAFMCETVTIRSGGLASTDIADLNQALRRNINSARGYQPPIELAAQRLRATR